MPISTTQNVTDLSGSDKRSLEGLLGGPLEDDQQVCVMAFTPGKRPTVESRVEAATRIEKVIDQAATHASRQGANDDTIDEAVDAAMRAVRRRPAS